MKKIAFFPFHHDLEVVLQNKDKLVGAEIVGITSYKEDCLAIESLCDKYGLPKKSYEQVLADCDEVVLLDNYRSYSTKKYYSVISDANELGKKVIITPLAASQLDLSAYEDKYELLYKEPKGADIIDERYEKSPKYKLYDLDVPVIGIMGQGKNCGKFECQMLVDDAINRECKTAVISTNPLGVLFGYYTMPAFMYEPLPLHEKVFKFNMYVRHVESAEKPEMIIVGIPEGIVPFKERDFNSFAEYALAITSAISIDIAILTIYFVHEEIVDSGLQDIIQFCEERFRTPIGAVYMCNVIYEIPQSKLYYPITFEFLNNEYVTKYRASLENSKMPIFDSHNRERAANILQDIINSIRDNIQVI